jgi:hypothetical protein
MAQADPITTATAEGVSRGGSTKSTSLGSAHTEPAADPTHLDCLDKAFFSDAALQILGCNLNRKHLNRLVVDLQSEAVAVIRNAREDLRKHENWKVS